jgi:UMF1 family MFS transporter
MSLLIATVYKPEQKGIVYIFSLLVGIAYGWYYPSSNGYFVSLVPREKVTELWGINSFCSVILSWAPPLIFAALNESTGSLRLGLIGIIIFLVIGVLFGLTIPEHAATVSEEEKAVEMTNSASGDVENGEGTSAQSSPV